MQRLSFDQGKKDTRLLGAFNGCPMAIARAVTKEIIGVESLHMHARATEVYIFLRGVAEMCVGDETLTVRSGDVVVVSPGEPHRMLRILEELDYMTIRDTAEDDKVVLENGQV